jgi:hypothetical protein
MIDVNKNHLLAKKKGGDDRLKLVNELKIVSAPDDLFSLWSEVIINASLGELYNADNDMKFNERENWKQESCALSRDFFKPLGNLTYDDMRKMTKHILNRSGPKRLERYPKVTIKPISSVLKSCYSSKDYVERVKRKRMVKKEIHLIAPELGLYNAYGELIVDNWKAFKRSRLITSATMNMLIQRPGESYFATGKQVRARNKTAVNISPKAAAFFKVFLQKKMTFEAPTGIAHVRPYSIDLNQHLDWPTNVWTADTPSQILLGVLDFRSVPGVMGKETSTIDHPFFYEALTTMQKKQQPLLEDIKTWLFIVADETDQSQVLAFVEKNEGLSSYNRSFADYYPAKTERLYDLPPTSAKALKKVRLIFLQSKDNTFQAQIPPEFRAPDTIVYKDPRRFDELPFRMYTMELRMEFYLWLIKKFCLPGSSVLSVFSGAKLTCAALVSRALQFRSLGPKMHTFLVTIDFPQK